MTDCKLHKMMNDIENGKFAVDMDLPSQPETLGNNTLVVVCSNGKAQIIKIAVNCKDHKDNK